MFKLFIIIILLCGLILDMFNVFLWFSINFLVLLIKVVFFLCLLSNNKVNWLLNVFVFNKMEEIWLGKNEWLIFCLIVSKE